MVSYFVYGLFDPRDGALRYVGCHRGVLATRLQSHLADSRKSKIATHKTNWIRKLTQMDLMPIISEIQNFFSKKEMLEAEVYWISFFRSQGCRLTNGTDGGEGVWGHRHSIETRTVLSQKNRIQFSNPENRLRHSVIAKSQWNRPGSRTAQSALKRRQYEKDPGLARRVSEGKRNFYKDHPQACLMRAKPIADQFGNRYESLAVAARKLGLSQGNVSMVLRGIRPHTKGFRFVFAEK